MKVEQDYVMRMINAAVETLARILFHKSTAECEMPEEGEYTVALSLYVQLMELADSGKINEAENLLYEELDDENQEFLEIGVGFYRHINGYSEVFLSDHDYTRDEIRDGIRQLLGVYKMESMSELLEI